MIYKNIITEIGCIKAMRSAIFLRSVKQQYSSLILVGSVNCNACEERFQDCHNYLFNLEFNNLIEYTCIHIDRYYTLHIDSQSVFVEVIDSEIEKNYHKYIIETYDFAYIVLCKDYKFSITGID